MSTTTTDPVDTTPTRAADHAPSPSVQMVGMLAGFQISQALYVVAKLDIATALRDRPRPVPELAEALGVRPQPLGRLLRTLTGLGLFTRHATGDYAVTPLGATLAAGTTGSMRNLALTWMETHYAPFGLLADTVRTAEPAATRYYGRPFFDWLAGDPHQVEQFTDAMGDLTGGIKTAAVAGYHLPAGRTVADIGGADGTLLLALLEADPDPDRRGIVFDLDHVVPAAGACIADHPLRERVEAVGGDFLRAVPSADVYLLSMILHDWDDASCATILRRIAAAARPGARMVCLEFVVPPGDTPHMSTMIDLTMLGMLTGRERTAEEFDTLITGAGMRLDRIEPTPGPLSIIEATVLG
ncbi:MAG: methyltransferase [Pseudonocardiaceae bacterium]|nr:MAG: methyltransferase [Pseudonocardiaceae bacterium]